MKKEVSVDIDCLFHEDLVEFESIRKLTDREKRIAKSFFITGVYRGIKIVNEDVLITLICENIKY